MNPYDKAHELARALKASDELAALAESRQMLGQDPEGARLLNAFREKQMELSAFRMQGTEPGTDLKEEVQRLASEIEARPHLRRCVEAENRAGQLMADINRIIAGPFEELYRSGQG
ncbi:YlbF family regulator [Salinithrix halophila]|uniref:YlbF family regulator n=1 Tax=Salinithrix halophila TaxID=1485204 RepID=A0ABV8JEU5_9BACL